jgi:hypothetical protein
MLKILIVNNAEPGITDFTKPVEKIIADTDSVCCNIGLKLLKNRFLVFAPDITSPGFYLVLKYFAALNPNRVILKLKL